MPRKVAKTHRFEFSNICLLLGLYYLNAVASETVAYAVLINGWKNYNWIGWIGADTNHGWLLRQVTLPTAVAMTTKINTLN